MKIEEMVEEMNEATGKSLSITHYYKRWELHSFKVPTLFNGAGKTIKAKSFKELIEKAYERLEAARPIRKNK